MNEDRKRAADIVAPLVTCQIINKSHAPDLVDAITTFAAEVREEQREQDARICDEYPQRDPAEDGNGYWAAAECARVIRNEEKP
jgi:hypothetical protein